MKPYLAVFILTVAMIGAACSKDGQEIEQATVADHVFTNADVYTVDAQQPRTEAVAVAGTDIVYVGDAEGAEAFIGDNTTVIDVEGKMILPGFVDTHSHTVVLAGISTGLMMYTPPTGPGDKEKMLQSVADWIETHPDGPFFSFGGAYEGMVDIDRHDIDAVISDRPFLMVSGSGHGGWANTAALEAAGVLKARPDPIAQAQFGREPDGTPTGYIGTSAAVFYMLSKLESITAEGVAANIGAMLSGSSAYGVTTSFQAGHVQGMEDVFFGMLASLEESGQLPLRINMVAAFAQRPMHIEYSLDSIKANMPKYDSDLFCVDSLKIHGDGDFGGRTIGLLEPYVDDPAAGLGMVSFPDQAQLEKFMLDAAAVGVKHIHMHAIGDGTVRQALDAFEQVRKAGYEDIRLSTGHTYMVHPDDVSRFSELNVYADLHAQFAFGEPDMAEQLGTERYEQRFFPAQSLLESGAVLTIGADAPAGDENPFMSIAVITSRQIPGVTEVLPPESEALTVEQAIRAYTLDAARMLGMEEKVGSIEVGKRADLVIIDRSPFGATTEQIAGTSVLTTMMNGQVVYEAPSS